MQGGKPFSTESRHFEGRSELRPEGPQGPPWPPDSSRKVHSSGGVSASTARSHSFVTSYSQTGPVTPLNPQPLAPQLSPSHPQALSPMHHGLSRYQFTRRDLERCLYGKQEIAVVQIDPPKKEENVLEDKGKPAKWCDVCEEIRFGECPTHGPLPSVLPTTSFQGTKTYAISTFPEEVGLCRSSILFAGYGVFARHFIPLGTWIGPYEGKKVSVDDGMRMMQRDTPFMWEIYENGRLSHFLNASDENYSSWMRFIQCARHKGEQNLYVFQYYGSIYYRAFKDIPVGTELLVWYDEKYPQYLGVPLEIKDMSSCTVESIQTPTEVANRLTDEQPGGPPRGQPKGSRTVMEIGKHPLVVTPISSVQQMERARPQLSALPPPLSQAPGMSMQPRFQPPVGGMQSEYIPRGFLVAGPPERFTSEHGKRLQQPHTLTYGKEPRTVFPRPGHPGEELAKALAPQGVNSLQEKSPAFNVNHEKIGLPSPPHVRSQMPMTVYQYPSDVSKGGSSTHPYARPLAGDPGMRFAPPDHMSNRNLGVGHGPYVTTAGHVTRVSSKELSHGAGIMVKSRQQIGGSSFPSAMHGHFPLHPIITHAQSSSDPAGSRVAEVTLKSSHMDKHSPGGPDSHRQFKTERLSSDSSAGYEIGSPPQSSGRAGLLAHAPTGPITPPTLIHVDRGPMGSGRDENQNEIHRNQDPAINGCKVEWKCAHCFQRFVDHSSLKSHSCGVEKDKLYQCARCSSTFQTAKQLDSHVLSHTQDRVFRCGLCSISFPGASDLDAHMRMHNNVRALEHTDGRKPLESS